MPESDKPGFLEFIVPGDPEQNTGGYRYVRKLVEALGDAQEGDLILLPAEALNSDGVFIDDLPQSELVAALAPAEVRTGYEITEALRIA